MATSADQSIEQEYEDLTNRQRLRAAVHFTTMKICQETEEKYNMPVNQQVIATITETVWRQMETFSIDLEEFARHARRSVISPDDVTLLVRRNPSLLKHIQNMHKEQITAREEAPYKPKKAKKVRPTQTETSDSEAEQQWSRAQRGPQQQRRTVTATVTAPQTVTPDFEWELTKAVEEAEERSGWRKLDVEAAYSRTVMSTVDMEQMGGDGELPRLPRRPAKGAPSHTVTSEMMQDQARAHEAPSRKKKTKVPDTGRRPTPDETEALFRRMVERQIQERREREAEAERVVNQMAADAVNDQRLLERQRLPGRRERMAEIAGSTQSPEVDMEEG